MVDIVKPLKLETLTDGSQLDMIPVEAKPAEDYLAARGVSFSGSPDYLLDKQGRVVIPKIPDGSQKITYSGTDISFVEFFETSSQITANRRAKVTITYTSGNPSSEQWLIYDTDGTTVLRTVTYTYTLTSGDITSMSEATT